MTDLPALGIDLGTTYSCVAQLDDFKPVALENGDGDKTTPSIVYFQSGGGEAVVGKHAKNELARDPRRVVQHIKRHMGVDQFSIEIDGRPYYPQQISAIILEQLVRDALAALGLDVPEDGPMADVVITVPAYFGGAERAATKTAGELAGLNVVSIINEPTAAAVAYGLTKGDEQRNVLVYDLGGGTFDVTVVAASSAEVRAVATGGDRELGGADWDIRLKSWVLDKFRDEHADAPDPEEDTEAIGDLDVRVEDAKQSLTRANKSTINFTANTFRGSYEITRDEFEDLTADLVERTLHQTELVVEAAEKKGVKHLDDVIMVGGMSRMPVLGRRLEEMLQKRYGTAPTPRVTDPDQIVAKGAALFAASAVALSEEYDPNSGSGGSQQGGGGYLPGPAVPKLVNITSRGYGVKAVHDENDTVGYVSWLIKPNDELPAGPRDTYYTIYPNQTEVNVVVFESATNVLNDDVSVNTELVKGTLTGLSPNKPARQPIDVTFRLGDEGILEIVALGPTGQRLDLVYTLPGSVPKEELAKPLPNIAAR
ncbi:MAG: Hsp70 family protein [Pseudonocardia sp.]